MELGMSITAPAPISTAHFINSAHQSVCLYVYTLFVNRQRLSKNVTTATNTYAVIFIEILGNPELHYN
jgi:hypothetical protein